MMNWPVAWVFTITTAVSGASNLAATVVLYVTKKLDSKLLTCSI
jgi:hypothetical protein